MNATLTCASDPERAHHSSPAGVVRSFRDNEVVVERPLTPGTPRQKVMGKVTTWPPDLRWRGKVIDWMTPLTHLSS